MVPDVAYNTLITDIVPAYLENLSISNSGPQITPTGITSYSWEVAPLAVNESGIITITGIVSPELAVDTTITNTAVISNRLDITPTNNMDTAVVRVIAPKSVYLPMIIKPAPIQPFFVFIGDEIPSRSAIEGERFYSTTIDFASNIPATGKFYLSTRENMLTPVKVDDKIVISLDGNELFSKQFSTNCQPVQSQIVEIPRNVVEQMAGELATVSYYDVCGSSVEASTIWLIWVP